MSAVVERIDVAAALAAAHAALDVLAGADLTSGTDDELLANWRELERLRRRLPTVDHEFVLDAERRGLPGQFAVRGMTQFLRRLHRLDPYEAAGRVRSAEAAGARRSLTGDVLTPAYPAVAAAQHTGAISGRHARVVVDAVEKLPDDVRREEGAAIEAELVELAHQFDPQQLGRLAQRVLAHLDPDGRLDDVDHRAKRRGLTVQVGADGSSQLAGELTAELTEVLLVNFDALAGPKPESDGIKDPRTARQRRHDALLEALRMTIRSEQLPRTAGVVATILVTMSAESYATGTGFATTGHGSVVPAADAIRWGGGDLRLLAVVIDRAKGITHYSSAQRLFSEAQRLAMTARDGGCTFPDCPAPPGQCEAHHLHDHSRGGPTTVANGALVCRYDHDHRIGEGWTAVLIAGRVGWIPPRWIDPEQKPRFNELHRPGAA